MLSTTPKQSFSSRTHLPLLACLANKVQCSQVRVVRVSNCCRCPFCQDPALSHSGLVIVRLSIHQGTCVASCKRREGFASTSSSSESLVEKSLRRERLVEHSQFLIPSLLRLWATPWILLKKAWISSLNSLSISRWFTNERIVLLLC